MKNQEIFSFVLVILLSLIDLAHLQPYQQQRRLSARKVYKKSPSSSTVFAQKKELSLIIQRNFNDQQVHAGVRKSSPYKLDYLLNVDNISHSLLSLLKESSGVYVESGDIPSNFIQNERKLNFLEKSIIVTTTNHAFLPHLLNFDCYLRRLKMKYLVFALDSPSFDFLSSVSSPSSSVNRSSMSLYYNSSFFHVSSSSLDINTVDYNYLSKTKFSLVSLLLSLGYHVLFADTDIAMLKDPFPFFLIDDESVDMFHSSDENCWHHRQISSNFKKVFSLEKDHGNTGFYYVRSNERTISYWKTAVEYMER
jgi:hypothetical protein